jgi:hypothetical protein
MRAILATALAVTLIAAGCGSSSGLKSGPTAVSTQADSWKVYSPTGGHYRISLPSKWVTIDAATLAKQNASAFEKANPALKGGMATFENIASRPGALVALDGSTAGKQVDSRNHFVTNILVRRADTGATAPDAKLLDEVMQASQSSVGNIPGLKGPVVTKSSIGGSPSKTSTYSFTEKTSAGTSVEVTEKDVFTVRDGVFYGVSCTTVTSDVARLNDICAHALESFAFTR